MPLVNLPTGKNTAQRALRPAHVVLTLLILLVIPLKVQASWESRERALMGTRVQVGVVHEDPAQRTRAIDAAFAEVARIEALMSTYIETSEISQVNRDAASKWVPVGDELYRLIEMSLRFSEMSGGAFDVTYDALGQHYDFRAGVTPDEATRTAAAARIDYRQVTVEPERGVRFGQDGTRINLGGIAKGYAVERAIGVLRSFNISSAMVSAGGDTRLLGARGGQPWMVGIQNPRDKRDLAVRLPLVDEAISTSGDYERYFVEDGVRYHHIFSPKSGQSATTMRSASVVGPDALWTDALSTTVFVMGTEDGLKLIESLAGYEAVIIDSAQQMRFSSGFSDAATPATVAQ